MENINNEREWYKSASDERIDQPVSNKQANKRKPAGWRIAGIILIVLLLIVGTSVASARYTRDKINDEIAGAFGDDFLWDDGSGRDDDGNESGGMPDSAEDFFDSYYQKAEDTSADVNVGIPECEYDSSFEIELNEKGEEMSLGDLYDSCSKSIVAIYGYQDDYDGYYWGTGIVLTEDGLILTNSHVIEDCDKVTVKLDDDTEYDASLVGADAISDIAVLKIEAEGLTCAQFGRSDKLRVGDEVAAIGNPIGEKFRTTLTNGIISAIDRDISYKGRSMALLQTNTALNSGNSGGALFNMAGQVIGITNMKMMSSYSSIEGIGFAIPSETVKTVVSSIVKYGKVLGRPSIGITVGAVPKQAREKYDMPSGVYVTDVQENSDAAAKGIKKGDVITEVNGAPVETTAEIQAIKDKLSVGDTLTLKIWRDGEWIETEITLMETNDLY